MKKETEKAYKMLTNRANVLLHRHLSLGYYRKQLDFRRSFDKAVYSEIIKLSRVISFEEIAKKQKQRASNRYIAPVVNYLNNPIYIDYKNNKSNVETIFDNHIKFLSGRNHWAKNSKDLIIISILKKHYKNVIL